MRRRHFLLSLFALPAAVAAVAKRAPAAVPALHTAPPTLWPDEPKPLLWWISARPYAIHVESFKDYHRRTGIMLDATTYRRRARQLQAAWGLYQERNRLILEAVNG